ncbi:MAG TPA: SH3 domain-containing C40 family peptidase, partial [Chloroflexia bacterium]|nr:SH3 domain-containing C40 family peptidase [Chloroflexia bacterium]
MEYAQHDAHRSAPSWPRALTGLALCAIAAVAALLVLTGSIGTGTPTAVTQSPDARSTLIEAGAPAANSPKQTAPQSPATLLAPTSSPAAGPPPVRTGLTTDDYVNLREGPGTRYPILSQLPADAPAQVLEEQDGWYRIQTPWESSGWVASHLFEIAPDVLQGQPPRLGTAGAVGRVNLRSGPGTGHPTIEKLRDGAVLEVLALEGDWYNVRTPRGTVGWVSAEYAALDWIPDVYGGNGAPAEAASSDIVRIAEEYLGARYVWGGSYPSGFDCSGFTWYVYRQVGVRIPAGSVQQFDSDYGRYVRGMDSLRPGDLVFFERTSDESLISHVGIYAGGGKMIAARSERLGVRYVSIMEPFWSSRFVGGIR